MYGYYGNHPQMLRKLLAVRTIYLADVRGAESDEEALLMRKALLEEIERRGKGRFSVVGGASEADAVLEADMEEELGPGPVEEPLPFELEPKIVPREAVYLRIRLTDPQTRLLIYKTDTKEMAEVDIDSIEKAAFMVMKNLMTEIELASRSLRF